MTAATDAAPPRWRPGAMSVRRQIVLATVAVTTLGMLLLTLLAQLLLGLFVTRDVAQVLDDRATTVAAEVEQDGVRALDDPSGPLVAGAAWVLAPDGSVLAGTLSPRLGDLAADLVTPDAVRGVEGGSRDLVSDADEHVRVLVRTGVRAPGTGRVAVAVAESLGTYERSESYALAACLLLSLVVILGAAGLARWTVGRAMRPVLDMATQAEDWSVHAPTRRFRLEGADHELRPLADSLDVLLERVGSALRAEQRLTAEMAHELRTPLTAVRGTADLGVMTSEPGSSEHESFADIVSAAERMAETIDVLVQLARADTALDASESARLSSLAAALPAQVDGVPVEVSVADSADDARVDAPLPLVLRCVEPLVSNAARFATTRVWVRLRADDGVATILVCDDGPGFAPSQGRAGGAPTGAGLGLPLARRVAHQLGGSLDVLPDDGGARVRVRLPLVTT